MRTLMKLVLKSSKLLPQIKPILKSIYLHTIIRLQIIFAINLIQTVMYFLSTEFLNRKSCYLKFCTKKMPELYKISSIL